MLDAVVLSRVVRAQAARDPERIVLVFENGQLPAERITAGQLATRSNQVAAELAGAGLRRGDRVAVMLRNNPEFVYGLVANSQLALPTVPVDPRARGEKLRYFLRFAECSALVTADYVVADEDAATTIREAGVRTWVVSTPEGRAMGLDYSADWPILNTVFAGGTAPDAGEHVEDIASPWLLAYTPGTTGDPKAIELGHDRMLFYRRLPEFFGYRADDVTYTGLSLTHGNALIATMMPAIWGAVDHAVLSRWFTRTRLWDICIDHKVTTWSNLGGIATSIYSEPSSPKDRAHRVRLVISAGMPREIWRAFEERFAVRVLEWYGTMEGGFAYNAPGSGPIGSFGKPPEGVLEMDVVDEDGRPVGSRQVGELVLRPAGGEAKLTYYKDPEASARKVRNGWLHTGDMVSRDEDGWFYFSHRREEGGPRKAGEFIADGFTRRVLAAN